MKMFGIIVIIFLSLAIILLYTWLWNLVKNKNDLLDIERKRLLYNVHLNFSDDIQILDDIINDEFTQYQIMNLAHVDSLYINPEMQRNIITEVLSKVTAKMSDDLYNKLSLYYKREYIDDIIFNKIKLVVINYTIEINGNYKK